MTLASGTTMASSSQRKSSDTRKGQPSVLQLLPFTANHVTDDVTSSADVTVLANVKARVFPVLAVTRTPPQSAGSISEVKDQLINENTSLPERKRVMRISSEKITKVPTSHTKSYISKIRPKSEYDIQFHRMPSFATFYSNEGGESRFENSQNNMQRSLDNDQMKKSISSKSGYFHDIFQSSYDTQNKEQLPYQRYRKKVNSGKNSSKDAGQNQTRASSGASTLSNKINMKELPRSVTPIVDNDPDKLNMNHVIALLQTSEVDVKADDKKKNEHFDVVKNVRKPIIYEPEFVEQKMFTNSLSQNNGVLEPSKHSARYLKDSAKINKSEFLKQPECKPVLYSLSNKDNLKRVHIKQDSSRLARNVNYSDIKTYHSIVTARAEQKRGPNSLHWRVSSDSQEEINISTMIRNINNEGTNYKSGRPFRLHRFLTIVPDQPPNVRSHDVESRQTEQMALKYTPDLDLSEDNTLSTANKCAKYNSKEEIISPTTNVSPAKHKYLKETSTVHLLALKKASHLLGGQQSLPNNTYSQRKPNVICLPSAEYESDEDVLPVIEQNSETDGGDLAKVPIEIQLEQTVSEASIKPFIDDDVTVPDYRQDNTSPNEEQRCKQTDNPKDTSKLSTDLESIKTTVPKQASPDQVNRLVTQLSEHHYLPDDISIPSSLFLNFPAPYLSHSQHSFNALPKENIYASHLDLINSSIGSNSFHRNQVRLTLRKERDKTSILTYMSDMEVL